YRHDLGYLLWCLALGHHHLGHSLAQGPVGIDASETEVGDREAPQASDGIVGVETAGAHVVEQLANGLVVHRPYHRPSMRVAFLGPEGTFTEEALLSQPDLAAAEVVPMGDIVSVIAAVAEGQVDTGVVPVENSIEGAVTATLDTLAFEYPALRVRR